MKDRSFVAGKPHQRQGGWASAKILLDTYGHFMPTETFGYADALTAPDATIRHQSDGAGGVAARGGSKLRAPKRSSVVAQGRIELPTRGFSEDPEPEE